MGDPCAGAACIEACEVYQAYVEVRSRQGTPAGAVMEEAKLLAPPAVSTEGLEQIAGRFPGLADPKAKPLSIEGPSSPPAAAPSRKDLLAAMPEEERKWLTEFAAPVILPEEEKLFLELTEPHQREIFKEEFWKRRELESLPAPLGPGYRSRYEEWRRLADEKYDGWRQDAGRMVIRFGEPASIEATTECPDGVEIWTYNNLRASGRGVERHLFYRPQTIDPRRLWHVGIPEGELFYPEGAKKGPSLRQCLPRSGTILPTTDRKTPESFDHCFCRVYAAIEEIRTRQGNAAGAAIETARLQKPPAVSTEGLDRLRGRFATIGDAKAKPLAVQGPSAASAAAPVSPSVKTLSTPAPARRKLSGKEVKELTAQLEPKFREFLQVVELIVTEDERQVFLQITDNYQKDRFIESFWRRRSVDSQGVRSDYQAIHTRRVELALEQFKNLHNDRAKILVINGAPDAIVPIDCQDVYVPIQIWYYDRIE
ncbi:MAG TPA: GWxTD domain-containing protein, partial [Thermoanaerobaculia bacterium]|nr:GWxTD domain-containing protein [Thermoanaerobaculia bacterium]